MNAERVTKDYDVKLTLSRDEATAVKKIIGETSQNDAVAIGCTLIEAQSVQGIFDGLDDALGGSKIRKRYSRPKAKR